MRLIVLGAVSLKLEELAAQAVSGLYAETYALPAPSYLATSMPAPLPVGAGAMASAGGGMQGRWTPERLDKGWERQLERLRELQPHAALILGQADRGAAPTPLQVACQMIINTVEELSNASAPTARY